MSEFPQWERELRATAAEELDALPLANSAAEALALVLDGAKVEPADENAPPSYHVRSAILLLAMIAFRTARATMLVISSGYEPEAHGLKRRLSEIHARAQAVTDHTTGQHARDWLDGRGPSTPRKIANKWGSLEVWDVYSASEHADRWWLMVPGTDDQPDHHGLIVQPHRHPPFSNAMLTEVAMECRDLAAALAVCRGGRLGRLEELDVAIDKATATYFVPEPGSDDAPPSAGKAI